MLKEGKTIPNDCLEANTIESGKSSIPKQAILSSVAENTLREPLCSIGSISEEHVDQVLDQTL